jgi:hypothetical protein
MAGAHGLNLRSGNHHADQKRIPFSTGSEQDLAPELDFEEIVEASQCTRVVKNACG